MTEPNAPSDELSASENQTEIAPVETHQEEIALPWRRWLWLPLLLVVLWAFNSSGDVDVLRERFDFLSVVGGWLLTAVAVIVVFVWALCKILDKVPMPYDE